MDKRTFYKVLNLSPLIYGLVVCSGFFIKTAGEDIYADYKYQKLRNEVISDEETDVSPVVYEDEKMVVTESPIEEEPVILEESKDTIEELDETEYLSASYVDEEVSEEEYSTSLLDSGYEFKKIDFEELKEINEDSQAWITIDGTQIDYPVVQGEDNEFYSHHDIYGNKSYPGTIFMDSRVNSFEDDELSQYTVIYGHKMKESYTAQKKTMFSDLMSYKNNKDYYNQHKFAVIYTPDGNAYEAEFFAGITIDAKNPIQMDTSLDDEEVFNSFMNELKKRSTFESDVVVTSDDKILELVTCDQSISDGKYCLYAKLTKQKTNYDEFDNNKKIK